MTSNTSKAHRESRWYWHADWYLGGIDGSGRSRNLSLNASFLISSSNDGYNLTMIADGNSNTTFSTSEEVITGNEPLDVAIRGNGGFVAKLVNRDPVSVNTRARSGVIRNRSAALFISVNGRCPLPDAPAGKSTGIGLYDIKGRRIKTISTDVDLPVESESDFKSGSGIHILKMK